MPSPALPKTILRMFSSGLSSRYGGASHGGQLNERDQLGVVDQRDARQTIDLIPRLGQSLIGVHPLSSPASY